MDVSMGANIFIQNGWMLTLAIIIQVLLIILVAALFERNRLKKLAYWDSVTGLPNRNELNRMLRTPKGNIKTAIVFLDLDRFKVINDTWGHGAGDSLVKEVGKRLKQFVTSEQQVYRYGGDEFIFVIKGKSVDHAEQLAGLILQSIQNEYQIGGFEFNITVSIGISLGSAHDANYSDLLQQADKAMYQAKKLGENRYCLYSDFTESN